MNTALFAAVKTSLQYDARTSKDSPDRGITKEQLLQFCDRSFIEKGENILITGSTGCGKSHLACALGRQGCMLGYSTVYFAMNWFIEAHAAARLDGTYIRWLNQIARTPLLIMDDFGLQPLDHHTKLALLHILERHHHYLSITGKGMVRIHQRTNPC